MRSSTRTKDGYMTRSIDNTRLGALMLWSWALCNKVQKVKEGEEKQTTIKNLRQDMKLFIRNYGVEFES